MNYKISVTILFICLCLVIPPELPAVSNSNVESFAKYDKDISNVMYDVYENISTGYRQLNTIEELYKITRKEVINNRQFQAACFIHKNINLITSNIEYTNIPYFINIILHNKNEKLAQKVLEGIKTNGDKLLLSNIKFIFAKYYFKNREFKTASKYISGIIPDLDKHNSHLAMIMQGIILQSKKRHRQAVDSFKAVSAKSPLYKYAQLNIAISYIRQGWWSDAHKIITSNLRLKKKEEVNSEFINRLYLMLGYSYLQQEYYRESRESFRNITKKSIYANSALLGIALTATNQNDNPGALSILSHMTNGGNQLFFEENYLLLPYIYERLEQYKTAEAAYYFSLDYYTKRLSSLTTQLSKFKENRINNSLTNNVFNNNTSHAIINILENRIRFLNSITNYISDKPLTKRVNSLISANSGILLQLKREKLNHKIKVIKSYISQTRYNIARVYDNSNNAK